METAEMYNGIVYEGQFDAAHRVSCMPEGHKCRNLHGHTWRYRVEIRGHGPIIVDFGEIKAMFDKLDHRVLASLTDMKEDSIFKLMNTRSWVVEIPVEVLTSEELAKYYAEMILKINDNITGVKLTIWESDHACAVHSVERILEGNT